MITGKYLSRRTLLRGIGTAIALPALDAMLPAFAATTKATSKSPLRTAFVYVPNGITMQGWTPASEGAGFQMTRLLEPLAPYRDKMLVLSGLTHNTGRALGDGPGDHARAASTYLTGVHPKKTAGADIEVGISVDQVAAQKVGSATKFPSIELACEDGSLVGSCDSGYSCAYSNSISWRGPSTPMPPEINPRALFEKLFGADATETAAARLKREQYEKSILDSVLEDTRQLTGKLGSTDRRKLDEYLSSVREIERRIEMAENDSNTITPTMDKPDGVPAEFAEHVELMFDLLRVAYQTDLTRISTFMMAREGSSRTYREIGISDGHHPLTHHRNNPEMVEKVARINRFHVEQFAKFIGKMNATPDGDGTLLDHTMIVYGSGLSDGNRHQHNDLPCVILGGGAGTLKTGRHVIYPKETPMTNLHIALLDRMGVEVEKLGDSNGELQYLSDLT
jgi:Protein of unknown function (DUF1552)